MRAKKQATQVKKKTGNAGKKKPAMWVKRTENAGKKKHAMQKEHIVCYSPFQFFYKVMHKKHSF